MLQICFYWNSKMLIVRVQNLSLPERYDSPTRCTSGGARQNTCTHVKLPALLCRDFIITGRTCIALQRILCHAVSCAYMCCATVLCFVPFESKFLLFMLLHVYFALVFACTFVCISQALKVIIQELRFSNIQHTCTIVLVLDESLHNVVCHSNCLYCIIISSYGSTERERNLFVSVKVYVCMNWKICAMYSTTRTRLSH